VGADAVRVAIRTLGCKVNRAESESLSEALSALGARPAAEGEEPDAVVVNTCTVTGEADAKARKEVRRALASTSGLVAVIGCLAALDADGLRGLGDRVLVLSDRRAEAVAGSVMEAVASARGAAAAPEPSSAGPDDATPAAGGRSGARTRALVKVQDGCADRCAYCIVPDARGGPTSVPATEIVARVAALHAAGTAEVVLTGVNIGRYADESRAPDLASLVGAIAATGIRRIRVSSVEPVDLSDRFLGTLATADSMAPHLHIPLQSGCDRTLAAMGRRYDTAAFARALARARASLPLLAVTTDVIVGFPGETDQDFAASLAFVESCGFAKVHVFRYSKRAGTRAAARADQVPAPVKAQRAAQMRGLSGRLADRYARSREGGAADVLVERVTGATATGTTEDHLRVDVACGDPPFKVGDVVRVTLSPDGRGGMKGLPVR
jgi:threonylcarbamoyladenosine tRNA methylthiotransferase MtaB